MDFARESKRQDKEHDRDIITDKVAGRARAPRTPDICLGEMGILCGLHSGRLSEVWVMNIVESSCGLSTRLCIQDAVSPSQQLVRWKVDYTHP